MRGQTLKPDPMSKMTEYLIDHPIAGIFIAAAHIAAAQAMDIAPALEIYPAAVIYNVRLLGQAHIPPLIMEAFQLGAWAMAMAASAFAIYGGIKKSRTKKNDDVS